MELKDEENFQKKCRLCGRLGGRFSDIFTQKMSSAETKPNSKLSQLIYKCLHLQVKEDDSLPKKICDECNKKLTTWQGFYKKCEQTQKRLQQYLENYQKSGTEHRDASVVDYISDSSRVLPSITSDNDNPAEKAAVSEETKDISGGSLMKQNSVTVIGTSVRDNSYKKKQTNKIKYATSIEGAIGRVKKGRIKKPKSNKRKNISNGFVETNTKAEKVINDVTTKENKCPLKHEEQNSNERDEVTDVKRVKPSESSIKSQKPVKIHQCHICEKTFPSRGRLNTHVSSHLNLQDFQCDKCSKKFCSKFSLRSHLETHSESRNYCCHHCGRLFHTASGLCNHVKLHSEETKRFPCPLCGKLFRQAGHLEQHQRIHTGERPHQCTECLQRFTTRCQLSRHVEGVHRCVKKHKCLTCGKEFLYSTNYKAHLRRHAGQRDNKCGECGKTFVTSNALFRHRRFHTGDKPFQCGICGKKFADCSNRKRHMLRHLQPPIIPKGRKSGPQPKLIRIVNPKNVSSSQQSSEQGTNGTVQSSVNLNDTKIYSQLIQVPPQTTSLPASSGQPEGICNLNSGQTIQISGEVVQLCANSGIDLNSLSNIYTSQLPQQLSISSGSAQLTPFGESSNVYVSLSQDTTQLIQLSGQATNLLIQPLTTLVQGIDKQKQNQEQYIDQVDCSLNKNVNKFTHKSTKQKPVTEENGSTSCMTDAVHTEECVKQDESIAVKNGQSKNYYRKDSNKDVEIEKPKTYANLRTFLESSEVVETLSGGHNDDANEDNGVVNVEYVTLMADDGNEMSVTSGIQEIIVLPHETRISDYDLLKNTKKYRVNEQNMIIQENEDIIPRRNRSSDEQMSSVNNEPANSLTDSLLQSQNRKCETRLTVAHDKNLPAKKLPASNSDNMIEVFLSSTEGNKLSNVSCESGSNKVPNEGMDSTNLIQVLLESDSGSTVEQREDTDLANKSRQTFLISSDNFSDEDAIIRMLNSQGTIMLATRTDSTDFDLTASPIGEVSRLMESNGKEVVGSQTSATSSSFTTVDTAMTVDKRVESNANVSLISSSDYEHEISLTTAITLDNSDVSSMVRKCMSVDEELTTERMESGEIERNGQNVISSGSMDDIEMFQLCTEDLTKLTTMPQLYHVYHTGKSVENV
ncbi:uncharacterized protein [Periplaneta americana]|uniref:uncharacterized protein n=1 Tax=Periplaneta americana TaxID=6978 RepID=UPI0037E736B3